MLLSLPDFQTKQEQNDLRDRQAALEAQRSTLKKQLALIEAEQLYVARLAHFHLPRKTSPDVERVMKKYVLEAFIALAAAHQAFKSAAAAKDLLESI